MRVKSSETWTDPRLRGDDDTHLNVRHQFGEYIHKIPDQRRTMKNAAAHPG